MGDNSTKMPTTPSVGLSALGVTSSALTDANTLVQWTTHAQTSTYFTVQEAGKAEPTTVLLSNQWITAPAPAHARNADLLYWAPLQFDAHGLPMPMHFSDTVELNLASSQG